MFEGLFRPLAIIVSFVVPLALIGVPLFLICRFLWNRGGPAKN